MQKMTLFLIFIAILSAPNYCGNQGLSVGDALPNPSVAIQNLYDDNKTVTSLCDWKDSAVLLIVFLPDLTIANPTAKIIATGIDTYFAEGLSFRSFENYRYENPDLRVVIVTPNPDMIIKEQLVKYNLDFSVISDESMNTANFFGINNWESTKDASQIYVADKDNKIVYARTDFKGEGEKLKEVQSKLYSLFGLNESSLNETEYPLIMQGDNGRDFDFEYVSDVVTAAGTYSMAQAKLSDYFGKKNVLIAFYPAPYSLSCSAEVSRFDAYAEEKLMDKLGRASQNDLEMLMVSVSNNYILEKWKKDMNLNNVKFVNDPGGEISTKYNSYNRLGWNKRTVFLINKEGRVQYIDWEYNVDDDEDFEMLTGQILTAN